MAEVAVPEVLRPYVAFVTFSEGQAGHDGVELHLSKQGVEYARAGGNSGSHELAAWLMRQPGWQGTRTRKNVADEIATHALYAKWPLIGGRANPVNIEYFQTWPVSLILKVRDRLLAILRRR